MGVRTHSCDVVIGEAITSMSRLNVPINVSGQASLYSGRLFHLDANGYATVGGTAGSALYVAHRGVECTDVAGAQALSAGATGSVLSLTAGYGTVSGVPVRPGVALLTTEYSGTIVKGTVLGVGTADGYWTSNIVSGHGIAKCLEAATSINGRNQIKIMLVSEGLAKTV